MSALRQSDLGAALEFLADAEELSGEAAFSPQLIARLGDLIPADIVHFCELDRVRQRLIGDAHSTGEIYEAGSAPGEDPYWRLRHQHPACMHQDETGDFSACKVSDFVTLRQLRPLEIWEERFRHLPYELGVGLPAPPWHTKVFLFHRRGGDFRARDVLLLDLLRPHLVHLWDAAKTRRVASALAAGADVPGELVVFDAAHTIEFATRGARQLLRTYFDDVRGARVPALVDDWLNARTRRPLIVERGPRRLVVARVAGDRETLVLGEEVVRATRSKPLSYREWQVLGLVEEGKSNAEIATALWISPATVRTHLENIYAKLGVNSRTAALARARELRPAETA